MVGHDLLLPEAPQILSALDFELIFSHCMFRNPLIVPPFLLLHILLWTPGFKELHAIPQLWYLKF